MGALLGLLAAAAALIALLAQKAGGTAPAGPGLKAALKPPPAPPPTPAKLIGGQAVTLSRATFRAVLEPIAEQVYNEYGIQPRAALAHWAHETGYGSGNIFRATFNLGSITAGSWAIFGQDRQWHALPGRDILVRKTEEYVTRTAPGDQILSDLAAQTPEGVPLMKVLRQVPFRRYPDLLSAARDWAKLLSEASRYRAALAAAKEGNIQDFARALQAAGYGTDPGYAAGILSKASDLYA